MTNRVRFASIALAASAALALAACGDETTQPTESETAAMMPDTDAPVTDADGVAPDAGDTGVLEPSTQPPEEDPAT